MNDLYDWFSRQHHGLRTYRLFRQRLAELGKRQPDKRALYTLLSQLAGRYIEAFDEQPVPAAVADHAHERLLALLASLGRTSTTDGQLADLNRIAGTDLLADSGSVNGLHPSTEASLRVETRIQGASQDSARRP